MDSQEIKERIEDCVSALEARNCPFTDWETEFVESIYEQFDERGGLTDKPQAILERIWQKT